MQFRIAELKQEKARADGQRLTWAQIEKATGLRTNMMIAMNKGEAKQIRPEYLDALCQYFGVDVADLCVPEPVTLPLGDYRGSPDTKATEAERQALLAHIDDPSTEIDLGATWHDSTPLPEAYANKLGLDGAVTYARATQHIERQS